MIYDEYKNIIEKLNLVHLDSEDLSNIDSEFMFFDGNTSEIYPDINVIILKVFLPNLGNSTLSHIGLDAKDLNMTPQCLISIILMIMNPKVDCITIKDNNVTWFYLTYHTLDKVDYDKLKELPEKDPYVFVHLRSNVDRIIGKPTNLITNKEIEDLYDRL